LRFLREPEVLLKMPEEVSGEQTTEWRCTGHVVRIEPPNSPKGKLGVDVQFYCYEASRPEQRPLSLGAGPSWRTSPPAERTQATKTTPANAEQVVFKQIR
jgi:hypothetical protein